MPWWLASATHKSARPGGGGRSVGRAPLEVALDGQFTEIPARLIAGSLELVDVVGRQRAESDQQLQELLAPMAPQLDQRDRRPGVSEITARDIIAGSGLGMRRCGSAPRWSAGVGLSPGTNESAGKRRKGRMREGNRYGRRVLRTGRHARRRRFWDGRFAAWRHAATGRKQC